MRSLMLALFLPLAACGGGDDADARNAIAASGSGAARSYAATGFTAVDLRGADDADVRVGAAFSVRAEGDPGVLDRLVIARHGDALRIGRKSGFGWGSGGKAKIYVTMPRITAGSIAGAGDMAIDRIDGAGFDGSIAGAGNMTIGALTAGNVALSIAGSGNISARGGTAQQLEMSITGAGDIDARPVAAASATVNIAGSGNVHAAVDGPAKVSIMGSGDVDLGPKARCETSKAGVGSVKCGPA